MSEFIKQNKLFAFCNALMILLMLIAIFAPYLVPQAPYDGNTKNVLPKPSA